jgi:hypothetical protein
MRFIWEDEYKQEEAICSVASRWSDVVKSLKEINELEFFSIKN